MRIKELDALRGVAAFAVFLFHFQLFDYGYLGVHLFFIISGFVIFLSAESAKKPIDFVIARVSRLYPTYWVCLAITFAVLYLSQSNVTWQQLLFNLTMFQEFLGVANVDGAYWSLTEELVFYVIVWGTLVLGLLSRVQLWSGLMLCMALGGLFLQVEDGGLMKNIQSVVKYFNLFVAGIIFYRIYQSQKIKLQHGLGLAASLGIALFYGYGSYLDYFNHTTEMVYISSFYVLFTLLVMGKLAFLQRYRVLLFLGEISFPFYLLHQEIGLTFIRLTETDNQLLNMLMVAVVFVGITVMATLINQQVEHKSSRYFKKRLHAWYNTLTNAPAIPTAPTPHLTIVAPEPEEDILPEIGLEEETPVKTA